MITLTFHRQPSANLLEGALKALLLHIIASHLLHELLTDVAEQLGRPSSNIEQLHDEKFGDASQR